MIVCIFGCRHFNNSLLIPRAIESSSFKIDEIVTGGCQGVDKMADDYALNNPELYDRAVFYANWVRYGKPAGPKRNLRMALYVEAGIAIWDQKSRGTKSMIETLQSLGKPVFIYSTI